MTGNASRRDFRQSGNLSTIKLMAMGYIADSGINIKVGILYSRYATILWEYSMKSHVG